jgi:hypothetical protein
MPFLWFVFRRDSRADDLANSCPDDHSYGLADRYAHACPVYDADNVAHGRTDDGTAHHVHAHDGHSHVHAHDAHSHSYAHDEQAKHRADPHAYPLSHVGAEPRPHALPVADAAHFKRCARAPVLCFRLCLCPCACVSALGVRDDVRE